MPRWFKLVLTSMAFWACGGEVPCGEGEVRWRECGTCGRQSHTCSDEKWGEWGLCEEREGCVGETCEGLSVLVRDCGICGTERRECDQGDWGPWSTCEEPPTCEQPPDAGASDAEVPDGVDSPDAAGPPQCLDGQAETRACGTCGRQGRVCADSTWGDWSVCGAEIVGDCLPGAEELRACGSDEGICTAGVQNRTCDASCGWGAWSACTDVGPEGEACGDLIDNDCDGQEDEGCACDPVPAGLPGELVFDGALVDLEADPARCLMYGLITGTAPELVVIDTGSKSELFRIALPGMEAVDLDLSSDGDEIAVAHGDSQILSIIDTSDWSVATIAPSMGIWAVVIAADGRVFFSSTSFAQSYERLWRMGTRSPPALDQIDGRTYFWPALAISEDDRFLFAGDTSTPAVTKYDISGPTVSVFQASSSPVPNWAWRTIVLGNGDRDVHFAGWILSADDLSVIRGGTAGERIMAASADGRIAVGDRHVFDAALGGRPVADLPGTGSLVTWVAALTAAGDELWILDPTTNRLRYQNTYDFTAGHRLGDPEDVPLSLSGLTRLLTDPVRARIYGIDSAGSVVLIDAHARVPIGGFWVAPAFDMALTEDGTRLFVTRGASSLSVIDVANHSTLPPMELGRMVREIETVAYGQLAITDFFIRLIDPDVGIVASASVGSSGDPVLASASNGTVLFGLDTESVYAGRRYAIDPQAVTLAASGSGPVAPSAFYIVPRPDGSGVHFGGQLLDGTTFSPQVTLDDIVVSGVPDGSLVCTPSRVYSGAGELRGDLPTGGWLQTSSADGAIVYVLHTGKLEAFDLTGY